MKYPSWGQRKWGMNCVRSFFAQLKSIHPTSLDQWSSLIHLYVMNDMVHRTQVAWSSSSCDLKKNIPKMGQLLGSCQSSRWDSNEIKWNADSQSPSRMLCSPPKPTRHMAILKQYNHPTCMLVVGCVLFCCVCQLFKSHPNPTDYTESQSNCLGSRSQVEMQKSYCCCIISWWAVTSCVLVRYIH